jgi:Protein of unknown function (DUF3788)
VSGERRMSDNPLDDRSRPPTRTELEHALGTSAALWDELVSRLTERHRPITQHWNFSGPKFGWSLRLKRRERIVVYLTPRTGSFQVGIVVGEKAAAAARQGGARKRVLALIDAAPRYAEGRGIRVPVTSREALRAVEELAALKMAP